MGLAACGQPPAPALAAAAGRGLPFSAARLLSSEPAAGHLLRPKEACVLEQFDSDARSVLVPHEHAPLAWQDRSEALQKTLELHGQAVPEMFMVFILKGKQYKATLDDVIAAETLGDDFAVNDCIKLDSVLLVGSKDWTTVGTPVVPRASVTLQVEEHTQTSKVIVFKKKRRKGYARSQGHRQKISMLRVVSLDYDPAEATKA